MRRKRWTIGLGVPLVVAILWGLGVPGHAQPGGPDAPAAIAARAKAEALAAARAQQLALLALKPARAPDFVATFGRSLDTSVWGTCYPEMDLPTGCTNYGNKDEFEWYLPAQDRVSGHVLKLVAKREPTPGLTKSKQPRTYYCRSGLVTTYPSLHFEYGFLQVTAKIPHNPGLWSALWLAATDNQWPPEMDMIENWGVNAETAAFFHPTPASARRVKGDIPTNLTVGWQTYSLSWTKSKIEFFVGDDNVITVTKRVPHQQMYFLANVAEYLRPKAGVCAGTMEIRSIKYWKY